MEVEQLCKISGANGTNAMGNISLVVMADIAANERQWRSLAPSFVSMNANGVIQLASLAIYYSDSGA